MLVKRFADAKPYEAKNHRDVRGLRLFGLEAGGPEKFVVGMSHFLPAAAPAPMPRRQRKSMWCWPAS